MIVAATPAPKRPPGLLTRLVLSPRFHAMAERLPFVRNHARAEGRALFDIVAGFVQSQALLALVELRVLHQLSDSSLSADDLARLSGLDAPRLAVLMQAGAALRLVRFRRGLWHLTPRGAAFLTVPGLEAMVRHHPVLYRDLSDPVAFFKGETEPELAAFWPYVFGALKEQDAGLAARYSALMADSQGLVAQDTLKQVDLADRSHLMDVGGGTGKFLSAVAARYPRLALTLFDLPQVVAGAEARLPGLTVAPGSFRDGPLPAGRDAISLIRVLYDHADAQVDDLLAKVHAALPVGGRILVSEPMSGGQRPDVATDVYFAVYTLAMRTGRTRSQAEIAQRLARVGFSVDAPRPSPRPFITSVVTARRG